MSRRTQTAKVTLHSDKPTTLTFQQLHDWVIWQIPKPVKDALSGAVKPAIPEHQWYPAIVDVQKEKVQVYGHLDNLFDTPEKASKFLLEIENGSQKP